MFLKIVQGVLQLVKASRISNVLPGIANNDVVVVQQLGFGVLKQGRYNAQASDGVTHNIPHGVGRTPVSFNITLENGITANQNYVVSADATNIVFVHQDAGAFVSTYIDWVAFG